MENQKKQMLSQLVAGKTNDEGNSRTCCTTLAQKAIKL